MSVLQSSFDHVADTASAQEVPAEILEDVFKTLAKHFWTWFDLHQNDKITSIKILFLSVTVRVHHLEPLFTLLFGSVDESFL